jgi:hypothetical protein
MHDTIIYTTTPKQYSACKIYFGGKKLLTNEPRRATLDNLYLPSLGDATQIENPICVLSPKEAVTNTVAASVTSIFATQFCKC